jgi:hypothetical protein
MVELQPSKLVVWVRFPSPAFDLRNTGFVDFLWWFALLKTSEISAPKYTVVLSRVVDNFDATAHPLALAKA